jgi:PTH1 family peptidyl-tRNA hydrolase
MKLIVGLGNPGKGYTYNRHNVGFLVLDYLVAKIGVSFTKSKGYEYAKRGDSLFLKPMSYMNKSGDAVSKISKLYDIDSTLLVYDDVSLSLGEIRIRSNGSAGGHNGVASIISSLETSEFDRIRVGIKNDLYEDLSDYVLSNFSKQELEIVEEIKVISSDLIERYLLNGYQDMVNHYSVNKISYSEAMNKLRDQWTKGGNK